MLLSGESTELLAACFVSYCLFFDQILSFVVGFFASSFLYKSNLHTVYCTPLSQKFGCISSTLQELNYYRKLIM